MRGSPIQAEAGQGHSIPKALGGGTEQSLVEQPAACPGQGAAGKEGDVLPAGTVQRGKPEKVG